MVKSSMKAADKKRWEAIQQDNQAAFEEVYQAYSLRLFQEITKRISDRDAAQDILQDIFLCLWERRKKYQPQGEIYPYLYGMAINRVLNYYRKNKKQPILYEIWENLPESLLGLEELSLAFKQAHTQELETLLEIAISQLPKRMRQVYTLRFEDKKSIAQIASELQTSPNTVNNQLKEIRKRFVKTLKTTRFIFI